MHTLMKFWGGVTSPAVSLSFPASVSSILPVTQVQSTPTAHTFTLSLLSSFRHGRSSRLLPVVACPFSSCRQLCLVGGASFACSSGRAHPDTVELIPFPTFALIDTGPLRHWRWYRTAARGEEGEHTLDEIQALSTSGSEFGGEPELTCPLSSSFV